MKKLQLYVQLSNYCKYKGGQFGNEYWLVYVQNVMQNVFSLSVVSVSCHYVKVLAN